MPPFGNNMSIAFYKSLMSDEIYLSILSIIWPIFFTAFHFTFFFEQDHALHTLRSITPLCGAISFIHSFFLFYFFSFTGDFVGVYGRMSMKQSALASWRVALTVGT